MSNHDVAIADGHSRESDGYGRKKGVFEWYKRLTKERSVEEAHTPWIRLYIERYFKIKQRETTVIDELRNGGVTFISCLFILAVNPTLLSTHTDNRITIACATSLSAGISSILCGLLSNLPFILAPTTSTSLYLHIFLSTQNMNLEDTAAAIFILGIIFAFCGLEIVSKAFNRLIPFVIKIGICLGVGLIISLEALAEIGLVQVGTNTILDIGKITLEIYVAGFAFVVMSIAYHYRIRGAILIGLVCGTVSYWILGWGFGQLKPHITIQSIFIQPHDVKLYMTKSSWQNLSNEQVLLLIFDLFIIGIILLNGLCYGLGETAQLRREDDSLPRGKWLYMACGIGNMLSSIIGSGPVIISPESAPGIKGGARTGLSSSFCGFLFLLSTLIAPFFAAIPASGTSPVLLMIGLILFENAKIVNWSKMKEALPVYLMTTFIPFTYSIFNGVIFGGGMYVILLITTDYDKHYRKLVACYHHIRNKLLYQHDREGDGNNDHGINESDVDKLAMEYHDEQHHEHDPHLIDILEYDRDDVQSSYQQIALQLERTQQQSTASSSPSDSNPPTIHDEEMEVSLTADHDSESNEFNHWKYF